MKKVDEREWPKSKNAKEHGVDASCSESQSIIQVKTCCGGV